jgi:death-on-curing protein
LSGGTPLFLSVENLITIHDRMIKEFGGMPGIADQGLLESAAAMPTASFEGNYLHKGLAAMAAAYMFHICKNHPFFDGNKRVAVAAADIFLNINGMRLRVSDKELKQLCLRVAAGEVSKSDTIAFLEEHSKKPSRG